MEKSYQIKSLMFMPFNMGPSIDEENISILIIIRKLLVYISNMHNKTLNLPNIQKSLGKKYSQSKSNKLIVNSNIKIKVTKPFKKKGLMML